MDIGLIGTGRITRRLVRGLDLTDRKVRITRRNEAVSSELLAEHPGIEVVESAQEIVNASEVVFLCLPADAARALLPEIAFSPDQAVISVMAGMSLAELRAAVSPASDVCVTIPMPFVEQGGCPLPAYPGSEKLEALYGAHNPVIEVQSEAALQPFWAVAGTVASVIAELRTITSWLGEQVGDLDAAERYVTSLYGGSMSSLVTEDAGRLDAALSDLAIEGGLNARFLDHVSKSGHYDILHQGLDMLHAPTRGHSSG